MATSASEFLRKQQEGSYKNKKATSASEFLRKQNDVPTSWKERITGTPTKLKDGTYKANTGVLPFLAEIPKTLVSGTIGTGKTLGESMAVNSGAFDALSKANLQNENIKLNLVRRINENKKTGKDNTKLIKEYNRLNPSDSIKSLAPNSQISNLEALGNIGMLATEATSASAIARSGTAFGYLAGKEALKTLTKEQLKKQLIKEIAFNTAQGYITDVSMNAQNNKVDFKPGIGTALGFGLTGLVGNQAYNKTLNEQSAARIEKTLNQGFNIPAAGTKFDNAFRSKQTFADNLKNQEVNINPRNNVLDNNFAPGIDTSTTPKLNVNENAFVPTPKAEPTSILEGRAFVNPNKNDFIGQEIQRFQKQANENINKARLALVEKINENKKLGKDNTKLIKEYNNLNQKAGAKIPSNAQKIASDAWDRMHPIADTSKIKNIPTETPINKGVKNEAKTNQFNSDGFRVVEPGEVLPNGYTTKMNVSTGEQMTNAPRKEGSTFNNTNTQQPTPPTPEQAKQIQDTINALAAVDENVPPELRLGDLKTRSENFHKAYAENPTKMERVAMGLERDPVVAQEDALGAMSKMAVEKNDWRMIKKLGESNVGSQAASNFNGLKLAGENNIVKVIRDLKLSNEKKFPQAFKKSITETEEAIKTLRQYFKENNIPEKEFSNIMDQFAC